MIRINAAELRGFIATIFQHLNVPAEDAQMAAQVLVRADLRGVESHGINNINHYVDPLRSGELNPTPDIALINDSPVSAVVDGDGGMGLVVGVKAMDLCIAKAKTSGIAITTVRRSRHYGMASYHAMRCLEHDMIGVSLTNNSAPLVVPTYGKEAMTSTNPISAAVPVGGDIPFVLDMATSVVAFSKVHAALLKGENIPPGWSMDAAGQPTQDPIAAIAGRRSLPLGSTPEGSNHKGYGLSVLVDILTGLLSGGIYGNMAQRKPSGDPKQDESSCHFFMALRVDHFRDIDGFKADMDDMLAALRASEKADGEDRIYTHGEKEYFLEQERTGLCGAVAEVG